MFGQINDNVEMHRFEMSIGDELAVSYYSMEGNRTTLLHTEVPPQFSGQGVGSHLAHEVFEILRNRGQRVVAKCPFMAKYAAKHPEYLVMLDG
jgi:predicted GNAT family acetyltransferase